MGKAKILIVEDERTIVDCLKVILTQEGYNVCGIVVFGKDAVEIALNSKPDLIIMDIRLRGEIDGITAYEQIKKLVNIPAIFISTHADAGIVARAMQTGACCYLQKPFKNSELTEKVKEALVSHSKQEVSGM